MPEPTMTSGLWDERSPTPPNPLDRLYAELGGKDALRKRFGRLNWNCYTSGNLRKPFGCGGPFRHTMQLAK